MSRKKRQAPSDDDLELSEMLEQLAEALGIDTADDDTVGTVTDTRTGETRFIHAGNDWVH